MDKEQEGQVGTVVQIIGPAVDVEFSEYLPPIYQALRITSEGFDVEDKVDVVAELQQHLAEGRVRAGSMLPIDGMVRGMKAHDLGGPIPVPVGRPPSKQPFSIQHLRLWNLSIILISFAMMKTWVQIMGDLQTRRAIIMGMDSDGHYQKIMARVPLAELYQYSSTLRSLTQGRAKFTMDFAEYSPVPGDLQQNL